MDITYTQNRREFLKASGYLLLSFNLYGCSRQSSDGIVAANQSPDLSAPVITLEPSNTIVLLGQPATFQVTADGTEPLTYQWYKDGQIIPDANETAYTIIPTSISENDSTFWASITNKIGTLDSRSAILTINSGTTIDSTVIQIDSTLLTVDEV